MRIGSLTYAVHDELYMDGGHLFHTYLAALGIKSSGHFTVAGQKMPVADPAFEPIDELLA